MAWNRLSILGDTYGLESTGHSRRYVRPRIDWPFSGIRKVLPHTPDTKIDEMMLRSMFSMISLDGFRILGFCGSARGVFSVRIHSVREGWPRMHLGLFAEIPNIHSTR